MIDSTSSATPYHNPLPAIRRLQLVTVFFAAMFTNAVNAQPALPEFDARYAIEKFGVKLAEARYQLAHTATGYRFSQDTELAGFASVFRDDTVSAVSYVDRLGEHLLLKKHSYKQTGKEKNRDEDFAIEWHVTDDQLSGNITGTVRGREISLQTDVAIWEVLSFQIPLMIEANKSIKEYPYTALLKGEIDTYNFVLTSSKKIFFAGDEYEVLQLLRTDLKKNRQLYIWLAPALHNMPVIVENYRDGKLHSRMRLESLQFNGEKTLIDKVADNNNDY